MPAPDLPYPRLLEVAKSRLDVMRERIARYVHAESPTGGGDALRACADLIVAEHERVGGRVERVGDHLVTRWPGAAVDLPEPAGHLVVLGHYDTVWPVGQLADMPYRDDGRVIAGPGTFDMKAGLVLFETALEILAELDLRPAREVRAVVVADEEIGSPDGRAVVEREATGAAAVLGLEPPHPGGDLKTGRRGSSRILIRVEGREAHAALDRSKGISAIDELLDQLQLVREGLPEDGPTLMNIGRIEGGTRANVIPGAASAEIGLRFGDPDTEHTVLDRLLGPRAIRAGAEVVVDLLSNRPAWAAPDPNPLLESVSRIAERLGQSLGGSPAAGAGDSNITGSLGIPTLDGFGPHGRGAHAIDEQLEVDSLVGRAALLAAVMADDAAAYR